MSLRPRNSAERGPSCAVGLALAVGALTSPLAGCEATDPPPEPAFALAGPLAAPAPSFVVWVDGTRTVPAADERQVVTCAAPVASVPVVDAPVPSVVVEAPPPVMPPVIAITPLPTRQVLATGVPECDAYAARVEACSEHTLGTTGEHGQALERIRDSLDAARRSWKVAAESPRVRTILADECSASLRSYLDTAVACRDI